jgi:hypothetical protein
MLKQITGLDVMIIKDYETANKEIGSLYNKFKEAYKIPPYLLDAIKADNALHYYLTQTEISAYIDRWAENSGCSCINTCSCIGYTQEEYALYMAISGENTSQIYIEKETEHYLDVGCVCVGCSRKRCDMLWRGVYGRIKHGDRKSVVKMVKRSSNNNGVNMRLSNS